MKMLAFLSGELTNAAYYFTTIVNVHKNDCKDVSKSFSLNGDTSWKPFTYNKRVMDVKLVEKKKIVEKEKKTCHHA